MTTTTETTKTKGKGKKKQRSTIAEKQAEMVGPIVKGLEDAIAAIEAGDKPTPWLKPWKSAGAGLFGRSISLKNEMVGRPYTGWNSIVTAMITEDAGYPSPLFGTFKQWKDIGGMVIKGQRGHRISFPVFGKKKEDDKETGDEKEVSFIRFYKDMIIFNLAQVRFPSLNPDELKDETKDRNPEDALPEELKKFLPKEDGETPEFTPIARAEEVAKQYADAPKVQHGGGRAYYQPASDGIGMPNPEDFNTPEDYYGTLFHEFAHSTGHESRLNRLLPSFRFGDDGYSAEELAAEMCGELLSGYCDITTEDTRKNAIAYLRGWYDKIKSDPTIIQSASVAAFKAMQWILNERGDLKKQAKPGIGKEKKRS